MEEGKLENPEKYPQSKEENRQKTEPASYDAESLLVTYWDKYG